MGFVVAGGLQPKLACQQRGFTLEVHATILSRLNYLRFMLHLVFFRGSRHVLAGGGGRIEAVDVMPIVVCLDF